AQMLAYPPSVEGYAPEVVGRKRDVSLGKKSGKKSIEYALGQVGVELPEDKIDTLLNEVKVLSTQKKGSVSLEEFKAMALRIKA
ncbi:MAG TPA: hypothetical protein PKN88_04665, partial [Bacillota bacterium]|nr:hypothetical protein [Bacillota bacterium]